MNFNFKRLLHSKLGKYIVSILLGLGLATLFRKACNKRNCLVFQAPTLNKIKNQAFKFDNKCYKFTPRTEACDKQKKIVEFA